MSPFIHFSGPFAFCFSFVSRKSSRNVERFVRLMNAIIQQTHKVLPWHWTVADDFRASVVFVRPAKVVVEKYWVGLDWWTRTEEDPLLPRLGVEEWCTLSVTGAHEETKLEGEILGASTHLGSMRNKTKTSVYTITTIITKEGKEGTITYPS